MAKRKNQRIPFRDEFSTNIEEVDINICLKFNL